ncbi:GNAT family N-acetyltransferase [Thaumasiovibrio subtropicus]|uniref:GNAT family N-acetyltransferase n=1 Tax=Thaumasiovibrio subtropicus TaxID=1891207 RepID=UPI000B3591CB|nr:GNAT family N-acetyltransferase [Thaumasiovibrio subtropicus]
MNVSLLTPTPANFPTLMNLVEKFFEHEVLAYEAAKIQKALDLLINSPAMGKVWLIEVNKDGKNTVVGHIALSYSFSLELASRVAIVDQFYLDPDWRSQGVGTLVIPAVEAALREEGIDALSMEVNIGNAGARRFYERMGYVPRRQHCIMAKTITVPSPDLDMVS